MAAKTKPKAQPWSPTWREERRRALYPDGVSMDDELALCLEEMPLVEAEMEKRRKGYIAYQAARTDAREGKNAKARKEAAARQEQHRPAYTSYKRANTRRLQLQKAMS